MNRQRIKNPTIGTQATMERAITLLVDCIGKDADPESATLAVFERMAACDRDGLTDIGEVANALYKLTASICSEASDLWAAYSDGACELQDNPDSLSFLTRFCSGEAGASDDLSPSLDALPPAVAGQLLRRHNGVTAEERKVFDRLKRDGELDLQRALEGELRACNAIAAENADAARNANAIADQETRRVPMPLCRFGPGGDYTREVM